MGDDSSLWRTGIVEECCFNSIFGTFEGHRIYASRKVAEKIEIQTSYAPSCTTWTFGKINGIWPRKTSFPAERGTNTGSRPIFDVPLIGFGMEVIGDTSIPRETTLCTAPQRPQKEVRGV
ncbi:MAG: hypothetical protein ABR985_19775 [Methanotrichaceae archaeon]